MSSVAVLTPESFAEHRSGLKDQEIPGKATFYLVPLLLCVFFFMLIYVCLCGTRLRPGGRSLHPHLPGGLPSPAGEGSAGGESRGTGSSVGEQDQTHQSVCYHPGQGQMSSPHYAQTA